VVSVPAGAVTGSGTLTAAPVTAPAPAAPTTLVGSSYELKITGARLTGNATVTLPTPSAPSAPGAGAAAVPAGDVTVLAFYDTTLRRWQPVASRYDSVRHTVTAVTPHLSWWGVLRLAGSDLAGIANRALSGFLGVSNAAQPSCPGESDLRSSGVKVASDSGGLLKWCAGTSGGKSVIRVSNNRNYPLQVLYPAGWTAANYGEADPVFDLLKQKLAQWLTAAPAGQRAFILAGGKTVQITAPPGASGLVSSVPSPPGYLVDAFWYGLQTLAMTSDALPGAKPLSTGKLEKVIDSAVSATDCADSLQRLLGGSAPSDAHSAGALFRADADVAVGCLKDSWKVAYADAGAVGALVVGVVLWLVDGVKLVISGLEAAVETDIYWRSYRIVLTAPSAPTSSALVLSLDGIGPAKLGANMNLLASQTGWPVDLPTPGAPHAGAANCTDASIAGPVKIQMLAFDGIVDYLAVYARGVSTPSGISVGSTEAQLRATYPGRLVEHEAIYDPTDGLWLSLSSGAHELLFVLHNGVVVEMRTGTTDHVLTPEGCLD
jgi:hypothetical protein